MYVFIYLSINLPTNLPLYQNMYLYMFFDFHLINLMAQAVSQTEGAEVSKFLREP